MYAVDDLSDAIDVTRNFLTSLSWKAWIKLAVVVFFVSGAGFGGPGFPTGDGSQFEDPTTGDPVTGDEIPVEDLVAVAAVVGLIVLVVALLFGILAAIMEFVLYESLRSGEVHVRRYAKRNLGRALWLFGFQLLLLLALAVLLGGPFAAIFLSVSNIGEVALAGMLAFVGYALLVVIGFALVEKFTTEFVAPIMLLEDRGPVAAWKRFWPTLTANLSEYVVYALLSWILGLLVAFGVGILAFFVLLAAAVVFGIPAFLLFAAGVPPAGAVVVVLGVLAFLLGMSVVRVPVVSYFRYYGLLVLGDTDPDLDLIPDRRRSVRTADTAVGGGGSGGTRTGDGRFDEGSEWSDGSSDDGSEWGDDTGWDDDSSDDDSRWNQ